MKYLKRFNQINEGYDYRMFQDETKKGEEVNYFFDDEFGNQFKVSFLFKTDAKSSELIYQQYNEDTKLWDMEVVSKKRVLDSSFIKPTDNVKEIDGELYIMNKSNIYKILDTVFKKILNDFILKNKWCSIIKIIGSGKRTEKDLIRQRTKVYIRYFTNHPMIGWRLKIVNNIIFLIKEKPKTRS